MKEKSIKPTAEKLTSDLYRIFGKLEAEEIDPNRAAVMTKAAGHIISTHRDGLRQELATQRTPNLRFYRSIVGPRRRAA